MKIKRLIIGLAAIATLAACSGEKERRPLSENPYFPEEVDEDTTYVTFEEAGGDSLLVGSTTYSKTERELSDMLRTAEDIASPYMLQMALADYDSKLQNAENLTAKAEASGKCSEEELATLHSTLNSICQTMDEKMSKFSMPAIGVIGALKSTTRAVENVKNKEELDKLTTSLKNYFKTLPTLHLIVQEPSQQREVHRLAKELQRTLERKQAELR